ncbi:MAG: hypothetical protein ABSE63_13535 [Thermoguttaceae bacterium]
MDENIDAKVIADANAKAIAAIHSAVMEIKGDLEIAGESPAKLSPQFICTWILQNDEVKIQQRDWIEFEEKNIWGIKKTSIRNNYTEYYNGPNKYICLMGYDPENLPVLTEHNAKGVFATTGPGRSKPYAHMDPNAMLLFTIGYTLDSWSLSELVDKDQCKIVKTPSNSASKCYELEIVHKSPNLRFMVSVDPSRNYLIQKVECYKDNALSYTAEVSSYVISNGLYIPKELKSVICQSTDSSKKPTVITVYRYVTVKSINQVIPSEAFEITIPQWARVQDENTKKYYIWGKGKPYLTFDSVEAARQWEYEMNNKRYLWIPITAFVLIVLVPLIILFVYLKRHAKVSPPSK